MKKLFLIIAIYIVTSANAFSQKGNSQFSFFGGYEHFPELKCRNGYNVGVEFKHYLNKRIYALANFHAGVNDGSEKVSYTRNLVDYNFNLSNSVRDYMLGFGLGGDLLHINRHKIYMQGTVGIGSSEVYEDGITLSPGGSYDMVETYEEKSTRFAISASAGYDYQLTDWMSIGVNYTGWQIGYNFKSSANIKLGIIF